MAAAEENAGGEESSYSSDSQHEIMVYDTPSDFQSENENEKERPESSVRREVDDLRQQVQMILKNQQTMMELLVRIDVK